MEIVFLPGEAEGALKNGTRIRKVKSAEGDDHPDGSPGTVLSSHAYPIMGGFGYFVAWDDRPALPVFIHGERITQS